MYIKYNQYQPLLDLGGGRVRQSALTDFVLASVGNCSERFFFLASFPVLDSLTWQFRGLKKQTRNDVRWSHAGVRAGGVAWARQNRRRSPRSAAATHHGSNNRTSNQSTPSGLHPCPPTCYCQPTPMSPLPPLNATRFARWRCAFHRHQGGVRGDWDVLEGEDYCPHHHLPRP
jgi:hypothetical protein